MIFKSVKVAIWAILVLFVSSNGIPKDPNWNYGLAQGTYDLHTMSGREFSLKGNVLFERKKEISNSGRTYSVIELEMTGLDEYMHHSMGFLMGRQGNNNPIRTGTYTFNREIDGFLGQFEGVFGFANFQDYGEQPFFAKSGKLIIRYMNEETLVGSLSVSMDNARGETVIIAGDFNAKSKK
jgi:hypothetical protein